MDANRKHLLWIAIVCFPVGFLFIALGYPIMCCENGFAPPQASLYAELLFPGFADFHKTYGGVLVLIGDLSVIVAMVALMASFDWRKSVGSRTDMRSGSRLSSRAPPSKENTSARPTSATS